MKRLSYQLLAGITATVALSFSSALAAPFSFGDGNRYRTADEVFSGSAYGFGDSDFFTGSFAERILSRHSSFGLLNPKSGSIARNYVADEPDANYNSDVIAAPAGLAFDASLFSVTPSGAGSSLTKSGVISPFNSVAPDLFWRTDGTAGTWTGPNWSAAATASGGSTWTNSDDAFFTATSTATYITLTPFADVTVSNGIVVTVTAAGTVPAASHVYDIGSGSTLTWTGQNFTAAGTS